MKRCFKCVRSLPEAAFYRHKRMADGLLGKCKDCTRKDVAANRLKKIERVWEYDRQRATTPVRVALRARITRAWAQQYPERVAAQQAARRAAREAPSSCEACGATDRRLERHHPDYAERLRVQWLCKPCHYKADEVRRAGEASS